MGRPKLNLIGKKYGLLTVLEFTGIKSGHSMFLCECDCGNLKVVEGSKMVKGATKSCGCLIVKRKHGMRKTRLYRIWKNMRTRCLNPNSPQYKAYGGRGIKLCDEWKTSTLFIEWALANGYTDDLTIDRIDNNGNYCPENCRWVTRLENNYNRSITVKVPYDGEIQPLAILCKRFGVNLTTARYRIAKGWTIEDALKIPPSFANNIRRMKNEA